MQFSKIPGQTALKRRLIAGVQNEHIPHAQLFAGPEGSASLPLAIAYAQYIACENKNLEDSCGNCSSCIKMQKLIHPDLHFSLPVNWSKDTKGLHTAPFLTEWREAYLKNPFLSLEEWSDSIDLEGKKPFISAHEAHEIIKALQFVSVESEYKFMIIWLPELMNENAANRILKTLEEPSPKTLIILVTQKYEQLITTVRSRTQLIKILPFTQAEATEVLVDRFGADPSRAKQIADITEGNIADAIWMLQSGDEAAILLELFRNWMQYCYGFKIDSLVTFADKIHKNSREWQKSFLTYCLYMIRQTMIMNHVPNLNRVTPEEFVFIDKFRKFFHAGNYELIEELIEEAIVQIGRYGSSKIIIFDVSLLIADVFRKEKSIQQS
ncbi:MAG: DNA polymerase III subunit [Bacteroidia bacterium]